MKILILLILSIALISCGRLDKKTAVSPEKPKTPEVTTPTEKPQAPAPPAPVDNKQYESLDFMDSKVKFGATSNDFLVAFPDHKICPGESKDKEIKVFCRSIEKTDENGNQTYFNTYFKFFQDQLFEMSISERWMPAKYGKIIEKLTAQFKTVKDENNDEEGWFKMTLKKGDLEGNYGGDDDGTVFLCYDINLLENVKRQVPGYKND